MECGEAIFVKDIMGSYDCRFIAQCGGRFMLISRSGDYRNGYILADWHGVLREMVALAVPAKLIDKVKNAEGVVSKRYVSFPLTYPLSAQNFADLFGVDISEVRAQLADLAVQVDDARDP